MPFLDVTPEPIPEPVKEKMKLPIVHDACPVCGSKVRLGAKYIQQLKDEGVLHKDSFPEGLMHQIPMFDQQRPPSILAKQFKMKILLVHFDVCECGVMYCPKFGVQETDAQVQMVKQPPPQGFRGFQRGQR